MEVLLAKSAGFCFGVKKAVAAVYEAIEAGRGEEIYTYGSIIHNETVVRDLEEKGVRVLKGKEDLQRLSSGTVIIRSHGVAKEIYDLIEEKGLRMIDATCPFVKRIHRTVRKESLQGKTVVIAGDAGHPEVEGIVGWIPGRFYVAENADDAEKIKAGPGESFCVVAQTTYNLNKFKEAVEIFRQKGYNINVVNTICSATEERQAETEEIAGRADAMIVIGGANSSNTRKLYEIAKKRCANTYFIQTLNDLRLELPKSVTLVGITAGASTPNTIIEEVYQHVRTNF